MNILKTIFGGGSNVTSEEKKAEEEARAFEMFKYDGVKALRTGNYDFAVKCFEKALSMQEDLEVRDYLSQALVGCDRLPEALDQLRVLADAEPDNIAIYLRMAHTAYMMEDYVKMHVVVAKITSLDANNARAYFLDAQAFLGEKNMINAIAMLTKSIMCDEDYADAYLLRARTLLDMGDVSGAGDDVKWLLEHCDEHEDVLLMKARIEAARGNTDVAMEYFNKTIDVNPFSADAYKERGRLKYSMGDTVGAEQDVRKAIEIAPDDMSDVSGSFSAEGIEQKVRQAYSAINPFGI